jgi:hypothetical protein
MSKTLCAQTSQIIRQLAQIDGAESLNVVARRFPRFGPAERGTGFHQAQFEIACQQLPDALAVPDDADEIRITLQGALDPGVARQQFKQDVHHIFEVPTPPKGWDLRVHFGSGAHGDASYQVNVFTDASA